MAEKKIQIKRYYRLLEEAQSDPDTKSWLDEAYRPIGPYLQNRTVGTGLSFEEQRLLLPEQIGTEPTDRDFRKKVETFYHELLIKVPKSGIELEISLEDDSKALGEDNMPLVPKDYITYRWILNNPDVAKDEFEAKRNPTKNYYIVDPDKVTSQVMDINKLEDEVIQHYFKFKDDHLKVDMILTLMNVKNVFGMTKSEKEIKLKSFATKQQGLNEYQQKEAYNRFKSICEDKDLEIKYLIRSLVGAQVLETVGTAVLLKESGEKLGDDMKESVLFLKNAKNTRLFNKLKAEYELKVRKGDFEGKSVQEPTTKAE